VLSSMLGPAPMTNALLYCIFLKHFGPKNPICFRPDKFSEFRKSFWMWMSNNPAIIR